ncbi:DEAD-box ATP-dependent RNA helicase 16-like [Coffea arabica]|uniref:DEAD-box ATP-dependent RNA helicase 16-like n=1 Tax=Coffea arabica TaxID=13443 RepID=A0ABM4V0J2_COFAR
MPQSAARYVHRIGRTGRAYNTGASVSLVSPEENDMFEDIKSIIGESDNMDSNFIAPFPLLTKNAVEGLRYRAEKELAQLTCECERHIGTQSGGMEQYYSSSFQWELIALN